MAHNKHIYTAFKNTKAGLEERKALGFVGGAVSTNKKLIIGDIGRSQDCACSDPPAKPNYWKGTWPHMAHGSALQLILMKASSVGLSDGFDVESED